MIGIVDIGSNTIRLSCYEIHEDKSFDCIFHKKQMAGLANYIDKDGRMTEEGIERAVKALESINSFIKHIKLEKVHYFATAAIRNTVNCSDVISEIQEKTGCEINVISGEEEAVCGFVGVSGDNNVTDGCVIDIGGGSTEIVSFENKTVENAASFGIGSLNTYKGFVKNILPAKTELSEIKKEVKRILSEEKIDKKIKSAYGVGGTIRAVLRLYNEEYKLPDTNRIMDSDKIKKLLKVYSEKKNYMTDKIIKIAPERLHTLVPGLTILCTVLKLYNLITVTVSKYGVREGYLIRYILK